MTQHDTAASVQSLTLPQRLMFSMFYNSVKIASLQGMINAASRLQELENVRIVPSDECSCCKGDKRPHLTVVQGGLLQ
jgi:hypothetical protein